MKVQAISIDEVGILSRFSHMEEKFPRREGKNYFPSLDFYLKYYDDREGAIREEAEKMLEFAGLGNYRSNVKFAILDGAAGNIVLNSNMVAEITIDEEIAKLKDAVLATLAHEICHKVLHKNGIYFSFMDQENEVYTDLATFYVGFGDLTMNGYKIENHLMGYLTPDTYAMAYVLMTIINKNVNYNIEGLPMHARIEIDKAKRKCELSKTSFVNLNKDNYNTIYSDAFSEIRKMYEYYDLLIAALPEIQESLSSLSKDASDTFYGFDIKDLEWHKFSLAFFTSIFTRPTSEDNIILAKVKEVFSSAFLGVFSLMRLRSNLSRLNNVERHCPKCGHAINKVLEPREYHLICPKCKTHFVIDGNLQKIIDHISSIDKENGQKECNAIHENEQLKKEIKRLSDELEVFKSIVEEYKKSEENNGPEERSEKKNTSKEDNNSFFKRFF